MNVVENDDTYTLTKILMQSNGKNIRFVKSMCSQFGISFEELIKYHPDTIISPSDIDYKSIEGIDEEYFKIEENYDNFISNVGFFRDKGFDVGQIIKNPAAK